MNNDDLFGHLREVLGQDAVTAFAEGGDVDPRIGDHVSGVDVGVPLGWVRPSDTFSVAAVLARASEAGARVVPISEATTFWGGMSVKGALVLDLRSLTSPLVVDRSSRVARVGAGVSVRDLDVAARKEGLCLKGAPDADGANSVGSMLAVGTSAGLGLGYGLPVESLSGATAVSGAGEVLHFGTANLLGERGHCRFGMPDLLGLITSAQGRGAVITELSVLLGSVPYTYKARALRAGGGTFTLEEHLRCIREIRPGLDRSCIETWCVESHYGEGEPSRTEVSMRTRSHRSSNHAARDLAALLRPLEDLITTEEVEEETAASMKGDSPDYDRRWSIPLGEHRSRLKGTAFWGLEVNTSWGDDCAEALAQFYDLLPRVQALLPHHIRFSLYPSSHLISMGLFVSGRCTRVDELVKVLTEAARGMVSLGVVPYRRGPLWDRALKDRLEETGRMATWSMTEACLRNLDPAGVLNRGEAW